MQTEAQALIGIDWRVPRHRIGTRLLQAMVGCMVWFRISTEVRFAGYLWGPDGLSGTGAFSEGLPGWSILVCSRMSTIYVAFASAAAGALALIVGRYTFVATLVAYGFIRAISPRNLLILDGGDNVLQLVLVYMLLLAPPRARVAAGSFRAFLHNLGRAAITLQMVVIYLASGLYKASGERWVNGTALYVIGQLEWFSLPGWRGMFTNPTMTTLATYATMLFQLWFPMALFSPRLRLLWIGVGVVMHVFIGVFMGLVPFSLVMIGLELFLIPDDGYERLRTLADSTVTRAKTLWRGRQAAEVS